MKKDNRITVEQCCIYYEIETSFVHKLDQHGLIKLSHSGKKAFIDFTELHSLEKYMHLHYDLDINMEGMEAIAHLLDRVENLQLQVKGLKNELEKGRRSQ